MPTLLATLLALTCGADPADEYLSRGAVERILHETQGWGRLGLNTAIVPTDGRPGSPLQIRDRRFGHGLGCHANGEIAVRLEGEFAAFEALVGVQWQQGETGTVVFRVLVDGEERFNSGVLHEADEARPVRVDLTGAEELRLLVGDAGDGITCDCANWCDARLVRDPAASPIPRVPFDAAPFARVMTSDPARAEGTRAGRVQEFPAADVFLGTEVLPQTDGTWAVPLAGGQGALGLEWYERRQLRELAVEFAAPPDLASIRAEYWSGESPWQGSWQPLPGEPRVEGARWVVQLDWAKVQDGRRGTSKVRWLFTAAPPAIRGFAARTINAVKTTRLRLELATPRAGATGQIELYNGFLADGLRRAWDLAQPLDLEVTHVRPGLAGGDRTVLRFRLPGGQGAIAIDDLLADKAAWLPDFGLCLRVADGPSMADTRARAEAQAGVLAEVRRRPDQTFEAALEHIHYPLQDNGPTMLSLAADNAKFVVDRDGTIGRFQPGHQHPSYVFQLTPRFGDGLSTLGSRHLVGGWLPIPKIRATADTLRYQHRAYVVPVGPSPSRWAHPRPLAVSEYGFETLTRAPQPLALGLDFAGPEGATVTLGDGRIVWRHGERILAFAQLPASLTAEVTGSTLTVTGQQPGNTATRLVVLLPGWAATVDELAALAAEPPGVEAVQRYWHGLLDGAAQFTLPDPLLSNVMRASQVHCLMAARNEADGERVAAWIGADRYGPLESEAHAVVLGMDLVGHHEFARRSLDFFVHRYNPAGFLTTGYTIVGTGQHLWTLAEHHRVTGDDAWLRANAAEIARVGRWIAAQTDKTRALDPRGERLPEFGLVPPGVAADWNVYAYRFFVQAHLCAGLLDSARALQRLGDPAATELLTAGERYREDLLTSFRWAAARTPAMRVAPGRFVPGIAAMVHCLGRVNDFYPGEDWNRSWCGDVEIGAQHLAATGLLPPDAREVGWLTDRLEDWWALQTGLNGYPGEASQADPYHLGGFTKVQPYYTRLADLHALRDDVKPFVRSYFNAIPSLLNRENLSFWEHFNNAGGWNKTHETGWFLQQTAWLFNLARGDELWLAPFVPQQWLADGQTVAVREAPTPWGPVSWELRSHAAEGRIEARVERPTRGTPRALVLRVRHPDGRPMKTVTVNGQPYQDFDAARELVRLPAGTGAVRVEVGY